VRLTDLLDEAPGESTIVFGDERLTYADFRDRVARRAAGLRAWGVRPRDRVAIHMRNRLEWLEVWFATAWLDADLVPLNTRFTDSEVRYVLEHSKSQWLVWGPSTPEEHPARVHHLTNGVPLTLTLDAPVADDVTPSAETDAAAMVQYTSGSTAFPKGAVLGNASLVRNGHGLGLAWRMTSADVVLVMNPLFHCGGSVFAFLAGAAHGASIVLMDRWRVADGFRVMREECVTVFPGIDAAVRDLLSYGRATGEQVPTLRLVSTAADGALLGAVAHTLGCEISNVYGLTESSPNVCVGDLADPLDVRVEKIGRPQEGIEVAIRDPSTREELGAGQTGVIVVRGWSLMREYLNDPAATAATVDADGWLWTGDLGSLDEDGYLRFLGRAKQMIKSGGENVAIEEVEAALRSHPAVADAVVVPVPHDRFGEVGYAYLRLDEGATATPDEVLAHARQDLAAFKLPKHVEIAPDLPRTGSGKLDRRALTERAVQRISVASTQTSPS
jgi:acyl-CoA synthetase (AMP-forming)/AMP-acid ligase II